ncbi:hypothetical protein HT031_001683 [Scenedesmus sp. PABB004]|nr:hypothetical protein HT031_001683 [Scenedesmus sp. PABB004]
MASRVTASDLVAPSQDLLRTLERGAATLDAVARGLENEFAERFGSTGANPLEVAKRLRKLQRELPALRAECEALLSCKQELVDAARRTLDANTAQLAGLCARAGVAPPDDQGVHGAYAKAVCEWERQMLPSHAAAPCPQTVAMKATGIAMCCLLVAACAVEASAGAAGSRKLLGSSLGGGSRYSTRNSQLATNTVRAQAATSQAILEAVNSGANINAGFRAGRVGSATSWAAAQNDRNLFDLVEQASGPGNFGRKRA